MAHLKIATPESTGNGFARGALASVWINGMNISPFCGRVHVDIDPDGIITADVKIFVSKLELGIDANLTFDVPELHSITVATP